MTKMVKRLLAFMLLSASCAFAQGPAPQQNIPQLGIPDCQIGPFTVTTTGRSSPVYDNRFTGCTNWTLYEFGNGSVATVSIELDQAPDSNASPGTWVVWPSSDVGSASVHPLTTITADQSSLFEFYPWISVNVTVLTGAGANVTYMAFGYRPKQGADASANGIGSGSSSNCNGAASGSATSGNPCLVAGSNGVTVETIRTNSNGGVAVQANLGAGSDGVSNANTSFAISDNTSAAIPLTGPLLFNGVSWDRAITCNKSAFISALAATTTQIVAGVAAQKIRVCHIYISNNSATAMTVTPVEGTGTNCGTGQTQLWGKILLNPNTLAGDDVDVPFTSSGPLTTNVAADALCMTGSAAGASDVSIVYEQH